MYAIELNNITKIYRLYSAPKDRLREILNLRGKKFHKEHHALSDVSFKVRKGETVGIMGQNGSGKSTLLQIICGVLRLTYGCLQVNGKIAALLELGAGFNPDFTGRENVYMNGALMGFTRAEMDARFQEIHEFSEIHGFIDQPVKTYSSGMFVRLAFSVAISINPDILIIDEALSVGDAYFQHKCYGKLIKLQEAGTTLLMVSHSTDVIVKHCSHAILLDHGKVIMDGNPKDVSNRYLDLLFGTGKNLKLENKKTVQTARPHVFKLSSDDLFDTRPLYNKNEYRWGNQDAELIDFLLKNENEEYPKVINAEERIAIFVKVLFKTDIENVVFGLLIKTIDGVYIYGTNSKILGDNCFNKSVKSNEVITFEFSFIPKLQTGDYLISLGVSSDDPSKSDFIPLDRRYDSVLIHVSQSKQMTGLFDLSAKFSLLKSISEEVVLNDY